MPPSFFADELPHLVRADSVLKGELLAHRRTGQDADGGLLATAGVDADSGLVTLGLIVPPGAQMSRAALERAHNVTWGEAQFIAVPNTAQYAPVFYLPGAFALGMAKVLQASPLVGVIAGRMLTLLCYAALGAMALLVARHARALIFCLLAVPMSVSLAGSFTQDSLMVGTLALFTGLLSRCRGPASDPTPIDTMVRRPLWWVAAALLACVIMAKPPYLPLAGLMLTPLPFGRAQPRNRGTWLRLLGGVLLASVPGIIWSILIVAKVSTPFWVSPYLPGPLWPGDPTVIFHATNPMAQIAVLKAHPVILLRMPFQDLWEHFPTYVRGAIGILGMLNIILPDALYILWAIALVGALIEAGQSGARMQDMVFLLLAVIATAYGVCLVEYVTWTRVGWTHIDGVQGRYFLPLISLLAFAAPRITLPRPAFIRNALLAMPVLAALAGTIAVPRAAVFVYYLQ